MKYCEQHLLADLAEVCRPHMNQLTDKIILYSEIMEDRDDWRWHLLRSRLQLPARIRHWLDSLEEGNVEDLERLFLCLFQRHAAHRNTLPPLPGEEDRLVGAEELVEHLSRQARLLVDYLYLWLSEVEQQQQRPAAVKLRKLLSSGALRLDDTFVAKAFLRFAAKRLVLRYLNQAVDALDPQEEI